MNWKQFWGMCEHKWRQNFRITVVDKYDTTIGWDIVLECERCGDIKSKRV